MNPLRYGILVFSFWAIGLPGVAGAASGWSKLAAHFSDPFCQTRLRSLPEAPILLSDPPLRAILQGAPPGSSPLGKGWSSDLLVELVSELERTLGVACPLPLSFRKVVTLLKAEYLARLGVPTPTTFDEETRDALFRALVVEQKAIPELKRKVAATAFPTPLDPVVAVKSLYGQSAIRYGATWIIGKDPQLFPRLQKKIETWCDRSFPCPLWDAGHLYRVLVTEQEGLAVYVPELAVMLLSEKILREENLLHDLVIAHELAHLAVYRRKRLPDGEPLEKDFAGVAGWQKRQSHWSATVEEGPARQDVLTELAAKDSAFPLLPDPVLRLKSKGAGSGEGFLLARSYRESIKRNSYAEDLADTIAAAVVVPERFCWNGRPLAPQRHRWVKRYFLPAAITPSCLR